MNKIISIRDFEFIQEFEILLMIRMIRTEMSFQKFLKSSGGIRL